MSNFIDKAKINAAVTDITKLDLGHQRISTSDMMRTSIDYIHEMVPGEKIDVKMETFARLNPMPVPAFTRASMKHSAYFVPMRVIYRAFSDFLLDNVHIASDGSVANTQIPSSVPTITNLDLVKIFTSSIAPAGLDYTQVFDEGMLYRVDATSSFDIVSVTGGTASNLSVVHYNFTPIGRAVYSLLIDLGYNIVWNEVGKPDDPLRFDATYSLLPILAYLKVFADYYFPKNYQNTAVYKRILTWCNYDGLNTLTVDSTELREALLFASYTMFNSDYFTSQWDNPVAGNDGTFSTNYLFNDLTYDASVSSPNSYESIVTNAAGTSGGLLNRFGTPVMRGTNSTGVAGASPNNISEYALTALKSLTDFMKRNQLAGGAFEKMLSRYGVALPAEKMNRSVYLGTQVQPIQIGDVTSTSDTDGASLGSFAGKGVSAGGAAFDFSADEFGYFIMVTSIVPATGYFQGINPQNLRISRTQFYIPEFDNLGVEATPALTLYTPEIYSPGMSGITEQVFGFLPRYATYKTNVQDTLSGNFRCKSLNGANPYYPELANGANSWHSLRTFDLSSFSGSSANIVHSLGFMQGKSGAVQFKRLFNNNMPSAPDNFTIIDNFEIASYAPMKALWDTYEFEDKGKKITVDVGGSKVN